ncbi:MAG: hypothetical protein IPJ88_13275 [Myxococcales bacterium]|nr:MAG: hypothetical protein IPJ88_13275 [Myxococcales bacterium]
MITEVDLGRSHGSHKGPQLHRVVPTRGDVTTDTGLLALGRAFLKDEEFKHCYEIEGQIEPFCVSIRNLSSPEPSAQFQVGFSIGDCGSYGGTVCYNNLTDANEDGCDDNWPIQDSDRAEVCRTYRAANRTSPSIEWQLLGDRNGRTDDCQLCMAYRPGRSVGSCGELGGTHCFNVLDDIDPVDGCDDNWSAANQCDTNSSQSCDLQGRYFQNLVCSAYNDLFRRSRNNQWRIADGSVLGQTDDCQMCLRYPAY